MSNFSIVKEPDEFVKQIETIPAPIVLFGTGSESIQIFRELKANGYEVKYFCEEIIEKSGMFIEGVEVVSIDYLVENGEFIYILIAMKYEDRAAAELNLLKYPLNAIAFTNYIFGKSLIEANGIMYDFTLKKRVIYDLNRWILGRRGIYLKFMNQYKSIVKST